ncbi:hypothetical protein LP421_30695 (plasmid) [Rhizobium sp. RCAM05350]|nr:hypothetical protein LP421_30695 [Rhizobium sp. RCAM05350]
MGRLLGQDEQPSAAIVDYVADQLGIEAQLYAVYARRTQTRLPTVGS